MSGLVHGQSARSGEISGYVSSSSTGASLGNVAVEVEGTALRAVTNSTGFYRLQGVPTGTVTLRTRYLGLPDQVEEVLVSASGPATQNFVLGNRTTRTRSGDDVIELQEFSVIESREMTARALSMNEQKSATNLKNVVAFDEYGYTVDGNIGEFLTHIPGVAVEYSASIPVGVSIRGMPNGMSTVYSDGALTAGGGTATNPSRGPSLAAIATDNISRIEVTKAPTPDMPATGLGGSINIISDSAFNRKKPVFKFNAFTSFRGDYGLGLDSRNLQQPIEGMGNQKNASHILPSFNFSYLKPVNENLAVTVSGTQLLRYIHNDTFFPAWRTSDLVQGNSRYRVVPQVATTKSGQVKVDYRFNERHQIGLRFQKYRRQATQALGDFRPIYGGGSTGDRTQTIGSPNGVGQVQLDAQMVQRNKSSDVMSLDYKYEGDVFDITAAVSESKVNQDNYDDPNGYVGRVYANLTQLVIHGTGITSDPHDAASHVPAQLQAWNRSGDPVNIGDGNLYSIYRVRNQDNRSENRRRTFDLKIERDFLSDSPLRSLMGGLAFSNEKLDTLNHENWWNFRPGESAATRRAGNYGVVDPNMWHQVGPLGGVDVTRISPLLVTELMKDHPEYFALDESRQHITRVNGAKDLDEDILAAFVRADLKFFQDKLSIITGLRFERTSDLGYGPLINNLAQFQKDGNGDLVLDGSGDPIPLTTDTVEKNRLIYQELGTQETGSYDGVYPSLNGSFLITDNIVAKFAYAKTIGRPDLRYIIPGASVSEEEDVTGVRTINVVNTGLEPWEADSYDFTLEAYDLKGATASIGVFQKDIKNFFGATRRSATPEEIERYGGFPGEEYDILTQINSGDAQIRGFEVSYRQLMTFLPEWGRGLEAYVSFTKLNLEGSNAADFTAFNPETLNYGVRYIHPRFSIKYDITYQDETRRAPSGATGSYLWAGEKTRDTLSVEYQLNKKLSIYVQAQDLINGGYTDVQNRYDRSLDTPEYARFQRVISTGIPLTIGIKGTF